MELRAKPPVLEQNRFRALIYGDKGTGKTHLCCSLPNVYYIDTEGVLKYKKFVEMLNTNNSHAIDLPEITEIIKEVKTLLTVKHDYKTLVIDSLTFPYALLANMEAERLIKASRHPIEGTEFGANTAKPKRLMFHLGILLTRLDMNVIVVAHEKVRYENNLEVGKIADINDKMGYALGTVMHLRMQGGARKVYVEKTRYDEFKMLETIDFDSGYQTLANRMGDNIFLKNSEPEQLATTEQLNELRRLIQLLNVSDDIMQKWLIASKSATFDEMNTKAIQKYIDFLTKKLPEEQHV